MSILNEIKDAWGWVGIEPQEVVIENEFGNLIVKDSNDKFWRLCPEDVYCEVVAESIEEYNSLIKKEEFLEDWFMSAMVAEAEKALGKLEPGYKWGADRQEDNHQLSRFFNLFRSLIYNNGVKNQELVSSFRNLA